MKALPTIWPAVDIAVGTGPPRAGFSGAEIHGAHGYILFDVTMCGRTGQDVARALSAGVDFVTVGARGHPAPRPPRACHRRPGLSSDGASGVGLEPGKRGARSRVRRIHAPLGRFRPRLTRTPERPHPWAFDGEGEDGVATGSAEEHAPSPAGRGQREHHPLRCMRTRWCRADRIPQGFGAGAGAVAGAGASGGAAAPAGCGTSPSCSAKSMPFANIQA